MAAPAKSWFDLMTESRRKARSPEAEAQREYDLKAVAAMKKRLAKGRPKVRKGYTGVAPQPLPSRCLSEGEEYSSDVMGKTHVFVSKGHKCPDLF